MSRNVTGDVNCGQVHSLQIPTGTISGNITATWPDNDGPDDGPASTNYTIQYILAKHISGRILAGDETPPPTNDNPLRCSIRTIIVGQGANGTSTGIQGDILAYGGHIRHIESTGPIGSTTNTVNIRSGYGLTELFCTETIGTTQPRNVYANIQTNLLAPRTGQDYDEFGFIRNFVVSGNVYGTIETNVVRPPAVNNDHNHYEGTDPHGNTFGFDIKGSMNAPITVRQGVLVASLVAAEFTAPITIETYLKGKIIAKTGGISSLAIGTQPHTLTFPEDDNWASGFIGSQSRLDWDIADIYPFPNSDPMDRNEPFALIRAHTSINSLWISEIAQGNKDVPAMVESPRIDSLWIGSLQFGVIWSGLRTGCTPTDPDHSPPSVRCGADPADPASYMELGDAEIGETIGNVTLHDEMYNTSMYVKSFNRLDIMNRHSVNFYFDDIATDENLRIGCAFGRQYAEDAGLIQVLDENGLHGQITINAHARTSATGACVEDSNGDSDLGWFERVSLPNASTPIRLAWEGPGVNHDPSTPADVAPYYDRLPSDLGGGSVGLVPFHLHDLACVPPLTSNIEDRTFSNAAFGQRAYAGGGETYQLRKIELEFYGPIYTKELDPAVDDRDESPVRVTAYGDPSGFDYSRLLDITVKRGTGGPLSRIIDIQGRADVLLPDGSYVITPSTSPSYPILCDGLFDTTPATTAAAFEYTFKLWSDCNQNGIDDGDDIFNDSLLDIWPHNGHIDECFPWECEPDVNQDGNVDQDDVAYLQNVIGGGSNPSGCDPDYNHDGNADQDDVAALVNSVGGGGCPVARPY